MTKRRRTPPASLPSGTGTEPIPRIPGADMSARGAGINFDLLRPLLLQADDDAVAAAVAAYDAALEHARRLSVEQSSIGRRAEAKAAYKAEAMAAALEHREPTLSWSNVQAAEAAEADHAANMAAARQAIGARNHALATAMRGAGVVLLRVVAVERDRVLRAGEDPAQYPGALYSLYQSMVWPALAYGAGRVRRSGALEWWWPLTLGGWESVAHYVEPQLRYEWNEWAWTQLARPRGKGYSTTDEGRLQFRDVWTPADRRPVRGRAAIGVASRAAAGAGAFHSSGIEPGSIVMLGTGPHGEQGVTSDDLRWKLKPVTWG